MWMNLEINFELVQHQVYLASVSATIILRVNTKQDKQGRGLSHNQDKVSTLYVQGGDGGLKHGLG